MGQVGSHFGEENLAIFQPFRCSGKSVGRTVFLCLKKGGEKSGGISDGKGVRNIRHFYRRAWGNLLILSIGKYEKGVPKSVPKSVGRSVPRDVPSSGGNTVGTGVDESGLNLILPSVNPEAEILDKDYVSSSRYAIIRQS